MQSNRCAGWPEWARVQCVFAYDADCCTYVENVHLLYAWWTVEVSAVSMGLYFKLFANCGTI